MNTMSNIRRCVLTAVSLLAMMACKETVAPEIDEIWINMTDFPVERVDYAYPEQTLCLYGKGFTGLQYIEVNGTHIDVSTTLVYDTDVNITFQLPEDVRVSDAPEYMSVRVVTADGECEYFPFLVKPAGLQPEITSVSSTILVPGTVLTIKGRNLDGAKEVYVPAPYGEKVLCPFSPGHESTSAALYVTVPEDCRFATGQVMVVMDKKDDACAFAYTEKVYSGIYDFIN